MPLILKVSLEWLPPLPVLPTRVEVVPCVAPCFRLNALHLAPMIQHACTSQGAQHAQQVNTWPHLVPMRCKTAEPARLANGWTRPGSLLWKIASRVPQANTTPPLEGQTRRTASTVALASTGLPRVRRQNLTASTALLENTPARQVTALSPCVRSVSSANTR